MIRSVFVKVCYTVYSLDQHHRSSANLFHRDVHHRADGHRDMPNEHHRDVHHRAEKHGDVPTEHHRSFIDFVRKEVRMQLTQFVDSEDRLATMWQPFVVTYYTELTTLCLRDSLTTLCSRDNGDFLSLVTQSLNCSASDIRLAALQFLRGVLSHRLTDDDDDDDDDDDEGADDAASNDLIRRLLSLIDDTAELWSLLVGLLHTESHDECLVMVSCDLSVLDHCL